MSLSTQTSKATSSFTVKKINATTFLIREDDIFREHPFIYAKLHPSAPVLVLSDTGCDDASKEHKHDRYIHLRRWLEHCPVACNDNKPLNPHGARQYMIICTHCHFDHIGGILQFLRGGTTEIIASAAGRDFIESDLEEHGQFKYVDVVPPYYQVTKWAQAFERLTYTARADKAEPIDLGITIIQTPGHTPDELAWYDHAETHLYVGDSFYTEGTDGMPVLWPGDGNLIEWVFSMQKLQVFVRSINRSAAVQTDLDADDWTMVAPRVKISCAHQTSGVDGEEILAAVMEFWWRVVRKEVPVAKTEFWHGEWCDLWRDPGTGASGLSFKAPRRLVEDARVFFGGEAISVTAARE